jgi:hypothetical protein
MTVSVTVLVKTDDPLGLEIAGLGLRGSILAFNLQLATCSQPGIG